MIYTPCVYLSATSVFAYDGDNLVEETNSSGTAVARYVQGLNIDEPLAMLRSGSTTYYEADGLGSITTLSNSSGSILSTYTYDSFGKPCGTTDAPTNAFQYTARECDPETGLYFYRARYYNPSTGRFLSEDPIGFQSGYNFYVYVSNHATDLVDPSGLLQVCCRPANVKPAYAWAKINNAPKPCHCFLKLSDGTTLGGYHNFKAAGSLGGLDLRRNDKSDFNKQAQCTDVPGSPCLNDEKARRAFREPRQLGGYGFFPEDFGTSNDAAASLMKDSGVGITLPACAWGKGTGNAPPLQFGDGRGLLFYP